MASIEERLREPRKSGVYRATQMPVALEQAAHAANMRTVKVDAASAATKAQMLGLLGRTLEFPSWFGRNWDALEDCLTDASWLPEPGILICFEGFGAYAKADPDGFAILLDIFKTSAEYWRGEGRSFWVVFNGKPAATLELPVLLI
jgi:RNAse (barnase) inhibitor barstar